VELRPDYANAHNNLGNAYQKLGHFAEAAASYHRALALHPRHPYAHFSSSTLRLLIGDFERGWPEYEWRWKLDELKERTFQQSRWDGSPLLERTILLHAEQGFGDTIQFIRYAESLKGQNPRATIVMEIQPALTRLVAKCPGIDLLVAEGSELPPFNVYSPLASLPGILGTMPNTIPSRIPYINADRDLVEKWREKLSSGYGQLIGINWKGRQLTRDRDIPLECFGLLAGMAELRLISLQKRERTSASSGDINGISILELGADLDTAHGAFVDTAAIMMNLDLVITSDTAIPHLAGALGVPVWLALPYVPDWRWLLDRTDSPWYPSMRLFRQKAPGDWTGVFEEIKVALHERLQQYTADRDASPPTLQ
jgi:hypothetical protein